MRATHKILNGLALQRDWNTLVDREDFAEQLWLEAGKGKGATTPHFPFPAHAFDLHGHLRRDFQRGTNSFVVEP